MMELNRAAIAAALVGVTTFAAACGGTTTRTESSGEGPSVLPSGQAPAPIAAGDYGAPLSVKTYAARADDDPADGHPRLWVREQDLPRLRAWARKDNPVWSEGLAVRLADARAKYDKDGFGKLSACAETEPYCEAFAALFAFGSLVDPDEAERKRDAARGRKLLMDEMQRIDAKKLGDPLADPRIAVFNRSRWSGEAFGLAVDWLYPVLSKDDRALVRRVFLRWAEELLVATTTDHNHPEPVGLLADPKLYENKSARRYALNNYYAGHARNLALMSLSFDPADDPEEPSAKRTYPSLRGYRDNVRKAWWFVARRALENDARGGALPEGPQYGAQMLAYYAQMSLAFATAGEPANPDHPMDLGHGTFFRDALPAYLHFVTPGTAKHEDWLGPMHESASVGDAQRFGLGDQVYLWAVWGLEAALRGDRARLEAARWVIRNLPSPDEKDYLRRVKGDDYPRNAMLHFLVTDPDAAPARDPRGSMPRLLRAEGLGWVLARTDWSDRATWFGAHAGWASIDHQHGDGGDFFFYRRGEWVTKERAGYGGPFECTDQHNGVAIENAAPERNEGQRRLYHERGSQWVLSHDEDARTVGFSGSAGTGKSDGKLPYIVHVAYDTTGLYNSSYEHVNDVEHASRGITWVTEGDAIVVVDRVHTKVDGRFRRVFFQWPVVPKVQGAVATGTTPGGQPFRLETFAPSKATLTASAYVAGGNWDEKPAEWEPMKGTLRIEPATPSRTTVFLNVLTVADRGGKPALAKALRIEGGAFVGVEVGQQAVLAPLDRGALAKGAVTFKTNAARIAVTELAQGTSWHLECKGDGAGTCTLAPGGRVIDASGTLQVRMREPRPGDNGAEISQSGP